MMTQGADTREAKGKTMAKPSMITLDRYMRTSKRFCPEVVVTLEQVAHAVKRISNELARAALKGELGYSGAINVHGEEVEKLDTWSNNVFIDALSASGPVCTLISEEMEEPRHIRAQCGRQSYAVLYDPLDGSSNTDVNGSLGTVFAVRRRKPGHREDVNDVLEAGTEQIAAGYALYGPATMLVWTADTLLCWIPRPANSCCGARKSRCPSTVKITQSIRPTPLNGIPEHARCWSV
jgi:fructose-1,6-bisphosphatase